MIGTQGGRLLWVSVAAIGLLDCGATRQNTVIVYVSEDQVFSEPIVGREEEPSGRCLLG